jgi:malate dehydrogenase (oxaloacetate-decarboxylating)(NADP+)
MDTDDPDAIIQAVRLLEPTFGGINLEDIKAPECFYIEEQLKATMGIPVFHDDQHGTAIIAGAALLNALELAGKRIEDVTVVFSGAGAAGVAVANFYLSLGVRPERLFMTDKFGVVYRGRTEGMNPWLEKLAADTDARSLADLMRGADVFQGLSAGGLVTPAMVRSMADNPILFAMANPDPEIAYDDAMAARDDVIMATGRSDFPNQTNNVLGFPFIFRGALDVRATAINDAMKVAAAKALAELTREPVPYQVMKAYRLENLQFGREYILPKPFDPRVLIWEASAVAQAAMETGVARNPIDIDEYRERLEACLGLSRKVMRVIINRAKEAPKRIVYPEGDHVPILKACETILDEGMAHPILLGSKERIEQLAGDLGLRLAGGVDIIDPRTTDWHDHYEDHLYELRQRKGVTRQRAHELMVMRNYFGTMMVHHGDADGMIAGMTSSYRDTVRPALEVIGARDGVRRVAAMYMVITRDQPYFFADVAMTVQPTADELAEVAILCASEVRRFGVTPRVAMVSFSNFGGTRHPESEKMRHAVELVRERAPDLVVDGEMQAGTAVSPDILRDLFPFSVLEGGANVLVFPCLSSSNAAYQLVRHLGGAETVGPILLGMRKPVHILQYGGFDETDVINMTAIAAVEAAER